MATVPGSTNGPITIDITKTLWYNETGLFTVPASMILLDKKLIPYKITIKNFQTQRYHEFRFYNYGKLDSGETAWCYIDFNLAVPDIKSSAYVLNVLDDLND